MNNSDAPPDWTKVSAEVFCPLCNYNLRGLIEPRCPECGYRSSWRDLVENRNLAHPYLFEHHPDRNVGTFLHTLARSLFLVGFWRRLTPAHAPHKWRLLIYWIIVNLVALAWVLALICLGFFFDRAAAKSVRLPPLTLRQFLLDVDGVARYFALIPLVAFMLAWPWASAGVLLLFREAINAARIKPIHVLRTAIYSADVTILLAPLLIIGWCDPLRNNDLNELLRDFASWGRPFATDAATVYFVGAALLFVRMVIAARCYLRLQGAIGLAIISQLFVLLVMTKTLQLWLTW